MGLRQLVAGLVLACAALGASAQAEALRHGLFASESHDLARDLATANAAGKGLLVMFETADCDFCAEMRRKVFIDPRVREFYGRHFVAVAVRLDTQAPLRDPRGAVTAPADLARRHGLAGTPSFAFYDAQGQLSTRHQGALVRAANFIALGRYARSGDHETMSFAAWRRLHADNGFHSGEVAAQPWLDFRFSDGIGRQRHLKEWRGKVVLLAFGYTQCPDVCPTTLAEMKELLHKLGPDAARVQPVFISVDAGRDTPAMMGSYAAAFDARIAAGVVDVRQLRHLKQTIGLVAERQPGASSYGIDHSAGFYFVDAQGRLRLRSDYGQDTDLVLADLRRLLTPAGKPRQS